MRILYGVQGTGNGHLTRARVMAEALAKVGIAVDYLISGRPREQLFATEVFGDFRTVPGLTFHHQQGRIDLWRTLRQADLSQLWRDVRQLSLRNYDLVISDFEPVTAWAARRQRVPSLALSHQASFAHGQVPTAGFDPAARLLMKLFAPAQLAVGLHWAPFSPCLLPPVIDVALQPAPEQSPLVVVYLPFEDAAAVAAMLASHAGWQFACYHPQALQMHSTRQLQWHLPQREQFECDLRRCVGVIANSGFELPSEALHLGKKLLVKPLVGQFEQQSNALALRQLGLASSMARLDNAAVADFLRQPAVAPRLWPNVAAALAGWLAAGERRPPLAALAAGLWMQPSVNAGFSNKSELGLNAR